jgi:hypothetical protein
MQGWKKLQCYAILMQVSIRILSPLKGRQDMTQYFFTVLRCNFFVTLRSFGDQIQRHSDPTSKSLLGILRDLRIIVDVLANMNQSSHRSHVEILTWGDFRWAVAVSTFL